MRHSKAYHTKPAAVPERAVVEPEQPKHEIDCDLDEDCSCAPALPAGGHGRWRNPGPRGLPAGATLGGRPAPHWPPGRVITLPNELESEARALGLEYVGLPA